ncbi:MAG: hypothetical protein ACTTKH_07695, partial [Treponema sp.]
MGIFSLFKKQNIFPNIFIDVGEQKQLETKSGQIDYILSRSLYASIPTKDISFNDYSLGNYATKTYIDTLSSFISTPRVVGDDDNFNTEINRFIDKNKSTLIKIYRQAMIDGVVYVWVRIEKNIRGHQQLNIKLVPRENVVLNECIKKADGTFEKIVFESIETWKEKRDVDSFTCAFNNKLNKNFIDESPADWIEKKAKVRIEIIPYLEKRTIQGDIPPQYKEREQVYNSFIGFIPVFAFYNNQFSFLADGLPEIANVLPFIKKYNATIKKLETHLNNILEPKLKLHLKSAAAFLKNNLGIKESDYEAIAKGELKPDITQFKAAILTSENENIDFINQNNNIKSALDVLNLFHWIIVEMTMPEYLYGTALNTTNASVKEQAPVWVKKIEGRRLEYSQFYSWLIDVYYSFSLILNGKNNFGSDFEGSNNCFIEWEEMEAKDDASLMNALHSATDSILKALDAGLISPETAFNALKTFITIPSEYESE